MNAKEKMAQHFRVWGARAAGVLVSAARRNELKIRLVRETPAYAQGYGAAGASETAVLSILWNRRVMLLSDMPAVRFGDDPRTLI
jgi:hypothetical protein